MKRTWWLQCRKILVKLILKIFDPDTKRLIDVTLFLANSIFLFISVLNSLFNMNKKIYQTNNFLNNLLFK